MLIALSLTLMTMYVINFLLMTTQESFRTLFLELPKHVAYISLSLETAGIDQDAYATDDEFRQKVEETRADIMKQLKVHDGVEEVVYSQVLSANYQGIVGSVSYYFPLLEPEQVPAYLEHMDAKLVDGRMPKADGEILVDKKVFMNRKMQLDGYFMENYYGKVFKVVGVVESDYLVCVGTPKGYMNTGWYMTVYCNEENSDMAKVLKDTGIEVTEYDTLHDAVEWKKSYKEMVTDVLDVAIVALLVVVMVFLAISILVAYISFMRSRVNEYCLYSSIGFGRKEIYGMMMREIALIFGMSTVIGIVVTMIILYVFAHMVLDNMGLIYRYFDFAHLLRIVAAFMAIIGVLQIPILVTIHKIKTVDRMED